MHCVGCGEKFNGQAALYDRGLEPMRGVGGCFHLKCYTPVIQPKRRRFFRR